jgi:glycogen debranching enzyme
LSDGYHGSRIWVYEQAMIHYGATKFGLDNEASTAKAIAGHIGEGQELFGLLYNGLKPQGNNRQLWSVAAAAYFSGKSNLSKDNWL